MIVGMADVVIPWNVGEGNISVSFPGDKNGKIDITSDENTLWEDRSMSINITTTKGSPAKTETVVFTQKGKTLAAGTVFNFDYKGAVQEITLPKGKYKLQCWGAQGGTSYGSSAATGSKGGYSEGVLTLTETTTLYVFVGGKGSRGSNAALVNGGWNGGGAAVGYSSYHSGDELGESYPACGGGATDIALVTSSMAYSNGRTNRSSASLLSRIIVAGGGAGASYAYQEVEETVTDTVEDTLYDGREYIDYQYQIWEGSSTYGIYGVKVYIPIIKGRTYSVDYNDNTSMPYWTSGFYEISSSSAGIGSKIASSSFKAGSNAEVVFFYACKDAMDLSPNGYVDVTITESYSETTTETYTDSFISNKAQQGGGTSGKGQYPGTQTAGGNGNGNDGGFGYGGNQSTTGYRYVSGGAGGGWYGGGTAYSDSSTSYINYSGGGSGFVNTAANASYRPSGYTGLQLDSGTTTAGNASFPSPSGGSETGHSGNGYAKITVLDESYIPEPEPITSLIWSTRSGTWNGSSNSAAADGVSYTCVSPGSSGSTVIRCTFSGITSITFNCKYQGESNYDYLTVGSLDTACTRSSYGTTLKGTSGTAKDITFTCDSGEHYVEFCYSKDSSVDTSPDNATVYIKSYS